MGTTLQEQLIGLYVFFLTLNTIAVGLRLYVRLRLQSSAFGWDDVFLTITYVGMVLHTSLSMVAMHYGAIAVDVQPWHDSTKARFYTAIICTVCLIISGTVKISVALVIYRLLDYRPVLKAIVIADIVICCIWTVVYTLIISLGCTGTRMSPYKFDPNTCENVMYAEEATYIIFSIFQVIFPAALLWNTQIRTRHKVAVITLFSLGGLASIAVVFKLLVVIELYNPLPTTEFSELWRRGSTWSTVEHGLSLFAASVLAVGPLCTPVVQGWISLSGSISRHYGIRRDSLPFSLFRRHKKPDDHIWAWAAAAASSSSSRRSSDRELVRDAADTPLSRGDSRGTLDSTTTATHHLDPCLALSPLESPPRGARPFDWDHWSKLVDGDSGLSWAERSVSYRESVPPYARSGTAGGFNTEEAMEGGKLSSRRRSETAMKHTKY